MYTCMHAHMHACTHTHTFFFWLTNNIKHSINITKHCCVGVEGGRGMGYHALYPYNYKCNYCWESPPQKKSYSFFVSSTLCFPWSTLWPTWYLTHQPTYSYPSEGWVPDSTQQYPTVPNSTFQGQSFHLLSWSFVRGVCGCLANALDCRSRDQGCDFGSCESTYAQACECPSGLCAHSMHWERCAWE